MGIPAQHYQSVKLNFSFQDQDSCSSQSTAQSCSTEDSSERNNADPQTMGFALSEHAESTEKFMSPMGTQNYVPQHPAHYDQSFPQFAVPFPDQYFNVVLSTYGPQGMMMPGRVPLPLDFSSSEPIYVNAKQYHGILRRRQRRAKLEARNELVRNKKPYLHESRHKHAMKRARGSGGRFLNTKKLQEEESAPGAYAHNISASSAPYSTGDMLRENNKPGTSTHSCSDATTASNSDDTSRISGFGFSGYSSRVSGSMPGGGGNYVWGKEV